MQFPAAGIVFSHFDKILVMNFRNIYCKLLTIFLSRLSGYQICCVLILAIIISPIKNLRSQTLFSHKHAEPVMYVNLMLPSADSLLLVDGTAAMYASRFSDNVDEYDANKLSNFWENISLFRNGQALAIEARNIPLQTDTLFIRMWGMKNQTYNLQVVPANISLMLPAKVFLVDNYLHTQKPADLYGKTLYSFTSNSDTGSYVNRFMLVVERDRRLFNNTALNLPISENVVKTGSVRIFPNPLTGNKITLQFNNMNKDDYNIQVSNLTGRLLVNTNIVHNGDNNEYYIMLKSVNVQGAGAYNLTITGKNSGKIIHLPLIIN